MNRCERFYTENKNRVQSFLLRMTGDYDLARDLVQESFTRYISRYDRDGGNCSLLFAIARNAAVDTMRKYRESQLADNEPVSRESDPERRLIHKQSLDQVLAAVSQLDDFDRQLIAKLATENFSYYEIGKIFNISEANVKVKVHRARLRIREILADGDL